MQIFVSDKIGRKAGEVFSDQYSSTVRKTKTYTGKLNSVKVKAAQYLLHNP